jgi:hypothetical protein
LYRDGGDYKKVQQLRDAFNKGGFFYIEWLAVHDK